MLCRLFLWWCYECQRRKNDLLNIDYESYLEDYLMNQIPQFFFSVFQVVHFNLLENNISVLIFAAREVLK
jgi:hypothetical protein